MKRLAAAIAVMLAGCGPGPPPTSAEPTLDLIDYFSGRTEGRGTIAIAFQRSQPLRVANVGRPDGAGRLAVEQRITEGNAGIRVRRWRMHCASRGRCGGWLTDATGPVSVAVTGNSAHIRYAMERGLGVDQWLVLRPDRRTLDNRLRVRKWGVTVARVDEVIRKLD